MASSRTYRWGARSRAAAVGLVVVCLVGCSTASNPPTSPSARWEVQGGSTATPDLAPLPVLAQRWTGPIPNSAVAGNQYTLWWIPAGRPDVQLGFALPQSRGCSLTPTALKYVDSGSFSIVVSDSQSGTHCRSSTGASDPSQTAFAIPVPAIVDRHSPVEVQIEEEGQGIGSTALTLVAPRCD